MNAPNWYRAQWQFVWLTFFNSVASNGTNPCVTFCFVWPLVDDCALQLASICCVLVLFYFYWPVPHLNRLKGQRNHTFTWTAPSAFSILSLFLARWLIIFASMSGFTRLFNRAGLGPHSVGQWEQARVTMADWPAAFVCAKLLWISVICHWISEVCESLSSQVCELINLLLWRWQTGWWVVVAIAAFPTT